MNTSQHSNTHVMNNENSGGVTEKFRRPVKQISYKSDIERFQQTQSQINNFIRSLANSVRATKMYMSPTKLLDPETFESDITCPPIGYVPLSPPIIEILKMLIKLYQSIDAFPPIPQAMRFGNRAFQQWYKNVQEVSQGLLSDLLPSHLHPAICEIEVYLQESFGNQTRIDYGTGHELSFILFLYCLFKVGFLKVSDQANVVLFVFSSYIELVRKIQTNYMLEPAGSRGVWGLDDYHFLPFLFGSSQLVGQTDIKTEDVTNPRLVDKFVDDNLYFNAINFIVKTKTGAPFSEFSPLLYDISQLPTWQQIANGLLKMYYREVLCSFPIVQHIYFGTILPFQ